jgi:hypothetical protein
MLLTAAGCVTSPVSCLLTGLLVQDAGLPLAKLCTAYQQLVRIVRQLFQVCRLVHADLSEYNILVHKVRKACDYPMAGEPMLTSSLQQHIVAEASRLAVFVGAAANIVPCGC